MKKCTLVFLSILVAAFFFPGCSEPGVTPGSSEYTISGKVIDSVTGDEVSDAKVGFGTNILTTDASGNYSFKVAANTAITGNFYVSKGTDYDFSVFSGLDLTPTSDLTYNLKIDPVDTSAYTTHTISGQIYLSGGVEIGDGSVDILIINENGGGDYYGAGYDFTGGTGYSIDTKTFGANCVLYISVDDGTNVFSYYIDGVDLSGATVTIDFTQPSSGFSTIAVTGIDGDEFSGSMVYSDSIYLYQVGGTLSGTTANVEIYNPEGKSFVWNTTTYQLNSPGAGDMTANFEDSTLSVPGTDVTLPVPSLAAPAEAVLGSSVSYNAGTLSFTGSADLFSISLYATEVGVGGYIMSPTSSVDLPNDIVAILTSISDGYNNWYASVVSLNTSVSFGLDIFLETRSESPLPGLEYVAVQSATPDSGVLFP